MPIQFLPQTVIAYHLEWHLLCYRNKRRRTWLTEPLLFLFNFLSFALLCRNVIVGIEKLSDMSRLENAEAEIEMLLHQSAFDSICCLFRIFL